MNIPPKLRINIARFKQARDKAIKEKALSFKINGAEYVRSTINAQFQNKELTNQKSKQWELTGRGKRK